MLCEAATGELQILEAQNAAVSVNSTAVITVYGSDYLDYCKFKSSLGINESFACNDQLSRRLLTFRKEGRFRGRG